MPHRSYMIPIWYRLIMYIQYSVRYGGIVITNQQDWVCITNNGGVYIYIWLVVSTPLKNISQIGSSSQLLGKHIYRYLSRYTTSKIPFKLDGHFTGDYDDDLGAHQGTDFARTDTNHQSIINSVSIQLFRIIKPDCRHQNHASNQSHHSLVILVISASLSSSSLIHIDSSSTDVPCGIPTQSPVLRTEPLYLIPDGSRRRKILSWSIVEVYHCYMRYMLI